MHMTISKDHEEIVLAYDNFKDREEIVHAYDNFKDQQHIMLNQARMTRIIYPIEGQ